MTPLSKLIADWRVQLMGHMVRLPNTRPARKALSGSQIVANDQEDDQRKPSVQPEKKIFRTWNQLVSSPQKSRKSQELEKCCIPLLFYRWRIQVTRHCKHLRMCLHVTKIKSHPGKKLVPG